MSSRGSLKRSPKRSRASRRRPPRRLLRSPAPSPAPIARIPAARPEAAPQAARETGFGAVDDAPTQAMPPVVVAQPAAAQPAATQPATAKPAAVDPMARSAMQNSGAMPVEMIPDAKFSPTLLLWPEPDESTLDVLDDRGYESVALDNFDALPRTVDELASEHSTKPSAVLVDPIAAPITRRGLRILRGAAINAGLPIVVTAGIGGGPAEPPQGPDPALLLQALTPPGVSLPRVLLIEARDDLAEA